MTVLYKHDRDYRFDCHGHDQNYRGRGWNLGFGHGHDQNYLMPFAIYNMKI